MYAIFYHQNYLVFITASDRYDLNNAVDKADDYMNQYLPEWIEVEEERDFGDEVHDFDAFLKQNPKFKAYKHVSLEEFCKVAR